VAHCFPAGVPWPGYADKSNATVKGRVNLHTKKTKQTFAKFILLLLMIAPIGCAAVGPDYARPSLPLPEQWHSMTDDGTQQDANQLAEWWQGLNDPVLTRLIEQAAADNLDAREALSRVRQARFQRRQTRAALFPSLDARSSATQSGRHDDDGHTDNELYAAGFDAGWELDVFGGNRRSVEAAQADLEAGVEDLRDVMVTLLAEVAVNYVDVRTYQARLAVAQRNLATLEETWQLLKALAQAGTGDELTVAQARYNLESARATLPDLEVGLETAMNRLAVLIGQPPGSLKAEFTQVRPIPTATKEMAVGVPADILRQRPDIRQAERALAAQTARVGEATADLYPKFTLSGSIGLEALSLGDLFSSPDRLWSFGPTIRWPVFDAGAIRSNIGIQEELRQQALLRYEAAVLSALEEVENALVTYDREQQKIVTLRAAAQAADLAAELAGHQYVTGMTGFSDVLDAQRSQLSFEDQMTQSQGAALTALVGLYKALGGGWQSVLPPGELSPSENDKGAG